MSKPVVEKLLGDILSELKQLRQQNDWWLTVTQLAEYLGVKPGTLYQYVNQDRIPYKKIPGSSKLLFSRQEIDEWIVKGNPQSEYKISGFVDDLFHETKN